MAPKPDFIFVWFSLCIYFAYIWSFCPDIFRRL